MGSEHDKGFKNQDCMIKNITRNHELGSWIMCRRDGGGTDDVVLGDSKVWYCRIEGFT